MILKETLDALLKAGKIDATDVVNINNGVTTLVTSKTAEQKLSSEAELAAAMEKANAYDKLQKDAAASTEEAKKLAEANKLAEAEKTKYTTAGGDLDKFDDYAKLSGGSFDQTVYDKHKTYFTKDNTVNNTPPKGTNFVEPEAKTGRTNVTMFDNGADTEDEPSAAAATK